MKSLLFRLLAAALASSLFMVTKPKPRERPVSRSAGWRRGGGGCNAAHWGARQTWGPRVCRGQRPSRTAAAVSRPPPTRGHRAAAPAQAFGSRRAPPPSPVAMNVSLTLPNLLKSWYRSSCGRAGNGQISGARDADTRVSGGLAPGDRGFRAVQKRDCRALRPPLGSAGARPWCAPPSSLRTWVVAQARFLMSVWGGRQRGLRARAAGARVGEIARRPLAARRQPLHAAPQARTRRKVWWSQPSFRASRTQGASGM